MSWFGHKSTGDKESIESLRHYFASNLIGRLNAYKERVGTVQKAPSFDALKAVFSEESRITQRIRDFTNEFNKLLTEKKITKDIFRFELSDYPNFLFLFFQTRHAFYATLKQLVEKNPALKNTIQSMVRTMENHNKYFKLEGWEFLRVIHAEHSIQNNNAIRDTSKIMDDILKDVEKKYTRPAIRIP